MGFFAIFLIRFRSLKESSWVDFSTLMSLISGRNIRL